MNLRFAPTLSNKLHIGNIRILFFNKLISDITNNNLILRIDYQDNLSDEICSESEIFIREICNKYLDINFHKIIYQKDRKAIYKEYLNKIPNEYKIIFNDIVYLNFKDIQKRYKYIRYSDIVFGNMKKLSNLIKNVPVYNIKDDLFFYNFTSVVDDIEQNVKIIVRGSDHVDNTFLQIMIFLCLGYENSIPIFCHIPLCFNSDGSKISKSSNNCSLDLEDMIVNKFILPPTLFKYLTDYDMHCIKELNLKLSDISVSCKNKYINFNYLDALNIRIIKNMPVEELKLYLKKIKDIDIDEQTLRYIQPFIIDVDKMLNGILAINKIRNKNVNIEHLLIQNHNHNKTIDINIPDYEKINILFNTNLGSEIIKSIDSDFCDKLNEHILKSCN